MLHWDCAELFPGALLRNDRLLPSKMTHPGIFARLEVDCPPSSPKDERIGKLTHSETSRENKPKYYMNEEPYSDGTNRERGNVNENQERERLRNQANSQASESTREWIAGMDECGENWDDEVRREMDVKRMRMDVRGS